MLNTLQKNIEKNACKKITETCNKNFVIDSSISGVEDFKDIIYKICLSNSKIILTSITISEFSRMQRFNNTQGIDARYILSQAAQDDIHFECKLIDETLDTPKDCIIKYCADNKENVTLLTSDKAMVLKARMYSINVHYIKHTEKRMQYENVNLTSNYYNNESISGSKVKTLNIAHRVGKKLILSIINTGLMYTRVFSNGIEYNEGTMELSIGDDILIAINKDNYISFSHFKIISLYAENNCTLIYSDRFYYDKKIDVEKSEYKSFLREIKHKKNL